MKIKIIAAVVDTRQLTLYKENGEAVVIPQGDPRLARIVAEATPFLARNEPVEVDIATETVNHYKDFEESSGGFVKFFRVAKNKLKSLFAASAEVEPKTLQPITLGAVPVHPVEIGRAHV